MSAMGGGAVGGASVRLADQHGLGPWAKRDFKNDNKEEEQKKQK